MNIDGLENVNLLPAARAITTANGTGVDISNFQGRIKLLLSSDAGGGSSPTMDVTLEDSDDDGAGDAYAALLDVDGVAVAFTQVTDGGAALQEVHIATRSTKAFVRAVETIGGGSPTFDRSLVGVGKVQNRT